MLVALGCLTGCAGTGPVTAGRATSSGTPAGTTSLSGLALPNTSGPNSSGPNSSGPNTAETATTAPGGSTRPSVPPSDEITGFWVLGTIGADSAGPCYEFRADDGRTITMYSSRAGSLAAGERIRARLVTPVKPIYCGSSEALRLLETKRAT